ncbi:MAG: nuclear transport factor 2 family protein [Bacteroidales bacterium]|nr:nuclear transport factor 2 family protein [Bacteroidales bacterium]
MKRYRPILIIPVLLFSLSACCEKKTDIEAEKKAIIELINAETEAYTDYDFEKVCSFYVHDSLNFRLTSGADDHVFLEGWDDIEDFFRNDLVNESPERPLDTRITVSKDDYRIKLYEESAYVLCTETWTYEIPDDTIEISSRQVRFLEKVEGEWKIVFLSFIGTSGYEEEEELEELGVGFNTVL